MGKDLFTFNGRTRKLCDMSEIHLDHSTNTWLGFKFRKEKYFTYECLLSDDAKTEFKRLRIVLNQKGIGWTEYFDNHVYKQKTTVHHNLENRP